MKLNIYSIFISLLVAKFSFGQSILETESELPSTNEASIVEEVVEKISPSKRIILLSNKNGSYSTGDYLSIIIDEQLVLRGIAAKMSGSKAGVKTIKIYSLSKWKKLFPGMQVKVLRGDDSGFGKKEKGNELAINDEIDETSFLEDDISISDNSKRNIKTDNIVGIGYGSISTQETDGTPTRSSHYSLKWMYQFVDNFWGEFHLGQSVLDEYPKVASDPTSNGLSTVLTNITLRLKYTTSGPYFTYFQPYLGYQIITAESDQAGEAVANEATAAEEIAQVEELEKSSPVIGITILKRLVPGWFVSADIGTDIFSLGFSLEF